MIVLPLASPPWRKRPNVMHPKVGQCAEKTAALLHTHYLTYGPETKRVCTHSVV